MKKLIRVLLKAIGEIYMETNSQAELPPDKSVLISQIRELYGRIVYTHKTQEKSADIVNKRNTRFKNAQLILSVLTTTSVLSRVFVGQNWVLIAATLLSVVQFGVTLYLKEYDLGKIAQRHADAALDLLSVRETYLSLLTDLQNNSITYEEAIKIRDRLQNETVTAFRSAPRAAGNAYSLAQKALKDNEEFTFSDEEIDKFLPSTLRKSTK